MKAEPRYGLWKSHGQDFVARLNLGKKEIKIIQMLAKLEKCKRWRWGDEEEFFIVKIKHWNFNQKLSHN